MATNWCCQLGTIAINAPEVVVDGQAIVNHGGADGLAVFHEG
jgi:hypothetical protein